MLADSCRKCRADYKDLAASHGTCKLCLRDLPLRKSHLLPAALYRLLRNDEGGNPNPWIVQSGVEVQTSKQTTAHLLCAECEQRFSKQGEHWLFANGLQKDGTFPFAQALETQTPVLSNSSGSKVYLASATPAVSVPALTYFAASVFWRASVWPWKRNEVGLVRLGPFEDRFRSYLLGTSPFPTDISALSVIVRPPSSLSMITHDPRGGRGDGHHAYSFPIPGIAFTLFVGRNIQQSLRRLCMVDGYGNPIAVSPLLEKGLIRDCLRAMNRSE